MADDATLYANPLHWRIQRSGAARKGRPAPRLPSPSTEG